MEPETLAATATRVARWLGSITIMLALAGCATQRPVLYPSAEARDEADAAIAQCMADAREAGLDYHRGGEVAQRTAEGGVAGGAAGAATGAVFGDTRRGAAAGAAHGATHGFFRGLFAGAAPDPVYRRFVERCLVERGYEPIGWR